MNSSAAWSRRPAAYQFAGLVRCKPMNRAMFAGTRQRVDTSELTKLADQAADVFLAAYGTP